MAREVVTTGAVAMRYPAQAAPQRSRRTAKQRADRQRRDMRELERELRERALQQAEPRRDDGPLPRID